MVKIERKSVFEGEKNNKNIFFLQPTTIYFQLKLHHKKGIYINTCHNQLKNFLKEHSNFHVSALLSDIYHKKTSYDNFGFQVFFVKMHMHTDLKCK